MEDIIYERESSNLWKRVESVVLKLHSPPCFKGWNLLYIMQTTTMIKSSDDQLWLEVPDHTNYSHLKVLPSNF